MTTTNRPRGSNANASQDTESAKQTSHSLILRVKENDPDAWERLVKLYSPLVYFWCQKSGLPPSDLNDIFQDVFHSLARNIDRFRPIDNGSFRGWLRTLTRNKLNDHFRKHGRVPQPIGGTEALQFIQQIPEELKPDPYSSQATTSTDELEIQHVLLRRALENIRENFSDQTWNAFWMVAIDGRETIDVANDLSMRPGTVRVAKSRVLKRLRLELGDSME